MQSSSSVEDTPLREFARLSTQYAAPPKGGEPGTSSDRPEAPRSSTEPTLSPLLQSYNAGVQSQGTRPRSPYSRSHLRSRSAASLTAPPMTRAHSAPTIEPSARTSLSPSHSPLRSSSPLRSPAATRPQSRRATDDSIPRSGFPTFLDIGSISEDSELDLTPRAGPERDLQSSPVMFGSQNNTFPRSRRRPSSPLHQLSQNPSLNVTSSPANSSPSFNAIKFNEPFPPSSNIQSAPFSLSGTSSLASTPTSFRSRSPSISSLETIPDSPDAEQAAVEEDNIARLKSAADEIDSEAAHEHITRRSSLDVPGTRSSWGAKDKRKRWSVCGAERRGDFEMETIWED